MFRSRTCLRSSKRRVEVLRSSCCAEADSLHTPRAQISSLQQEVRHAHGLIQTISSLRDRLLAIPSADSPVALEIREDLDRQTTAARGLFTSIQRRVRELEQGDANLRVLIPAGLSELSLQDVNVRQQQVGLVKGRFKEMIHRYAETEREHRAKQRARVERQLRVVSPNLPPEEMRDLVDRAEAGESTAIFAQAVRPTHLDRPRSLDKAFLLLTWDLWSPGIETPPPSRAGGVARGAEPGGRARPD